MNGTAPAPAPACPAVAPDGQASPLASFRRIVGVCDRYEAAWRAGQGPDALDFLAAVPEADRPALLDELRAIDAELRASPRSGSGSTRPGTAFDDAGPGPSVDSAPAPTLVAGLANPSGGPARSPEIDGYDVLGELGRGGMGVVYKARHRRLKRLVALKMILAGDHAGGEHRARFAAEAEAVARLSHPNIVQIYAVGEQDGRPYFALELVDGGSLARRLKGGAFLPREAAQLAESLARGIAAAHRRGIVHRDLKPANVLLTAEGIPKITDFGLAKSLAGSGSGPGPGSAGCVGDPTRSGAILGTPNYMAPEQADGRDVGPSADLYGLGSILYELLTGRPPFRSGSTLETLDLLRTREPEPPGRLRPRLPRDLDTICLKCLEKEPARRYASADDLADDLRAFLGGEPIRARPASRRDRAWRYARGRPAEAALAGAGGMATLGLAVGAWWTSGPLTAAATAVLGLAVGASHHGLRLKRALDEAARQRGWAERHNERLHLLLEMTRRLMAAPHLDDVLRLLGETATRLANAERATIFLVDRDRGELWSTVAMGDGVGEIRVPIGVGIAGTVAATGRTINIPDAYADPRFSPETDRRTGYTTRSLLAFPLADRSGRVLGVLQLLNKRAGPFLDDDEEILSALAASAALAVERAGPGPAGR